MYMYSSFCFSAGTVLKKVFEKERADHSTAHARGALICFPWKRATRTGMEFVHWEPY